jgi:hypothetical protein
MKEKSAIIANVGNCFYVSYTLPVHRRSVVLTTL